MIRGQVLHTFSTMKVLDPLGQDVTPDKVYDLREEYGNIQEISCIQSKALEIDFRGLLILANKLRNYTYVHLGLQKLHHSILDKFLVHQSLYRLMIPLFALIHLLHHSFYT